MPPRGNGDSQHLRLSQNLRTQKISVVGGGHRYSWILLDTVFFGYLANFWDPSIQVSKKNMFLRQTS